MTEMFFARTYTALLQLQSSRVHNNLVRQLVLIPSSQWKEAKAKRLLRFRCVQINSKQFVRQVNKARGEISRLQEKYHD